MLLRAVKRAKISWLEKKSAKSLRNTENKR
jgi:hypothetical protein